MIYHIAFFAGVGNSEKEDLPAKDAGIKTYLISNENMENKIGFDEIFKIIDNLNYIYNLKIRHKNLILILINGIIIAIFIL